MHLLSPAYSKRVTFLYEDFTFEQNENSLKFTNKMKITQVSNKEQSWAHLLCFFYFCCMFLYFFLSLFLPLFISSYCCNSNMRSFSLPSLLTSPIDTLACDLERFWQWFHCEQWSRTYLWPSTWNNEDLTFSITFFLLLKTVKGRWFLGCQQDVFSKVVDTDLRLTKSFYWLIVMST